ncbi:Serine protease SPPA [Carex littledalei]|uniref:Serine protease SPPA n=1 Tax=Carex littledalei TaxID=544730 RepID=A0A833QQE4_9POAL|nr:Serine protease SPPA [Carex littledalei]
MPKMLLSMPPPLAFHSLHQHARTNISSLSIPFHLSRCILHAPPPPTRPLRLLFTVRAVESSSKEREEAKAEAGDGALGSVNASEASEEFPSGEFEMEEFGLWRQSLVKLRMLIAPPWQRVRQGSVLSMKLSGEISDQLKSLFVSELSLPQICENFYKAAYDPRISGIYLHIDPLTCGWAKVDEIRRHIIDFKKSGKFVVSYMPIIGEMEYYLACACGELYVPPSAYVSLLGLTVQQSFLRGLLEKIGVEPEIQRIGKYKSAGDQLARKTISEEVKEMLTALLDNTYENWLDVISSARGKSREDVKEFLNSGVYQVERLKEEGWVTNILYDDEISSMLKGRIGQKDKKSLRTVDYNKYSRVKKWTLGLGGGEEQIAVIRASGTISRTRGPLDLLGSDIVAEQLIEKLHSVRESDKYKAVILRIDSPGGDALASDLIWREIRLLAESKPVIASMSDLAASGGYYMAMAAPVIVAENLTLTGSIGVVTGRFSLQKLYEKIGFNIEVLSRGKFSGLRDANQRPLRPDEAELFAKSTQHIYKQFRDKAAFSRSMDVDEMENVAQGRVWSGRDAASRGLVDSIGGFSRAVAIAKLKANIPQDRKVRLVELSKTGPLADFLLQDVLTGIGSLLIGISKAAKQVLNDVSAISGVQARMDSITFEGLGVATDVERILALIKDFLRALQIFGDFHTT